MTIDWSKAPEGATHYDCRPHATPAFMQRIPDDSRRWNYWNLDGELIYYGFIPEDQVAQMVQRPLAWNGEGLPPVGAVCEVTTNDGHNWHPWKVLFADEYVILVGSAEGKANYKLLRRCDADVAFRLIRTAEQIAEEERKVAIWKMACDCGYGHNEDHGYEVSPIFAAAYDKGYRKQVAQ